MTEILVSEWLFCSVGQAFPKGEPQDSGEHTMVHGLRTHKSQDIQQGHLLSFLFMCLTKQPVQGGFIVFQFKNTLHYGRGGMVPGAEGSCSHQFHYQNQGATHVHAVFLPCDLG